MKKLFTALLLLVGFAAFSQSIGYFRYDSIRMEKVGGNAELILLNGTRDSIGVLFNMGNGRTRFRTISSLGLSPNVTNGIRKSVDTLMIGDSLDRYTYLQIRNNFINNSSFNALRIGNRTEAQSINGIVGNHPLMLTYTPTPLSIEGLYGDAFGDVDSTFYGGRISTVTQIIRDSTLSTFGAGKRNEILAGNGGEFVAQYYPPRDSTLIRVGRDGQSGNTVFGQWDIGHSYGYNINVTSPSDMPLFPLVNIRSSIDLARVIDNTRRKKMVGSGIAGVATMHKTYQNAINMSTYEAGNYTGSIFGLRAYGDAYPLISGATKAKTLAVWEVNKLYGVYVDPQYLYTNTVRDGYAFVARGDSDYTHIPWLNIGPYSSLPSRAGLGNKSWTRKLFVNGDMESTGNSYAFVSQAYGMAVDIPVAIGPEATINFKQTDSAVTTTLGAYLVPADRAFRGGFWRSEMFSGAVMDNSSTGGFLQWETGVNHTNVTRQHRNGYFAVGHGAPTDVFRLYKKFGVGGTSVFLDTVTVKNIPTGAAAGDSVNYKPAVFDANGNLFKGSWAFAGSGGGGGSTAWNSITNPTGTQTLAWDDAELNSWTNGSNTETFTTIDNNSLTTGTSFRWNTSSLTTGNLLSLVSTSTALASGNEGLDIAISGANGTNAITATGLRSTVTNTNATSGTNVGASFSASGATTDNIAVNIPTGSLRVASSYTGMQAALSAFNVILGSGSADTRTIIVSNNAVGATLLLSNSSTPAGSGFYLGALSNDLVGVNISGIQSFRATSAGSLIIGTATTAGGRLTLPASTTSALSGQIKFGEGSDLTTPEDGTLNYVSNNLNFTETSTVYTLAKTLKATATLDFPSTSSGSTQYLTVAVTGAATGDPVALAVPHSVAQFAGIAITAWVSSSGTVTVALHNFSGSPFDAASASYSVSVIHY